jgi:hypothetical protein
LAQRTVVQPAQGGEHSNLQANPDARPVRRGEGLHDRLTHKIVGTLTIAGENPGEGAQMGNAGDDVRSPESAGLTGRRCCHRSLHKSIGKTIDSSRRLLWSGGGV